MPVYGEQPWQTVEGIEFRSATVIAHKFADGSRRDLHQAVIYRGPYARVIDDQGQVFARGLRTAVDGDSFEKLQREPYQNDFVAIRPGTPVDPARAAAFSGISAAGGEVIERPASVTKGGRVASPPEGDACCGDGGCC
jgi:hypothetical protein